MPFIPTFTPSGKLWIFCLLKEKCRIERRALHPYPFPESKGAKIEPVTASDGRAHTLEHKINRLLFTHLQTDVEILLLSLPSPSFPSTRTFQQRGDKGKRGIVRRKCLCFLFQGEKVKFRGAEGVNVLFPYLKQGGCNMQIDLTEQ